MRIELGGKWVLRSNSSEFQLAVKGVTEKGEPFENVEYHYCDFDQLLQGLARRKILESKATTFQELRDDLEAVRAEIEAIRKQFEFTVVKGKGVK